MRIEIAPGIRLFFDVDGFGHVPDGPALREKPTLLLLHGGPGFDHVSFKPLFSQLADVAQVITYDHRGHGRSDPRPVDEWTLDTWADDVVRLCDALGIVKPIVLGQSFGGFVAQRYLARHPDHPGKVVLSSTSPAMNLPRKLAMFERLGGAPARDLAERFWRTPDADTLAQYLRELMPLYNTQPPADPDARHRTAYRLEILLHFAAGEMQSMDLLPGLARARCPVLVMVGDEDPVCPLQDSLDIAAALPPPVVAAGALCRRRPRRVAGPARSRAGGPAALHPRLTRGRRPVPRPGDTLGRIHPLHSPPMNTKPYLSHAEVVSVLEAARAEALAQKWAVSIAVVDDGGHLLGQYRLDGAAPMSARMAPAKARSAALGRRETKAFEDMINQGRSAFLSAPDLEGMLEGGVPIVAGGHVIGAVGVSGVKSSEDVQIARAGIAALHLPA